MTPSCAARAGPPTPLAPSPLSWTGWTRRATGPRPARATTPSTARRSGPCSPRGYSDKPSRSWWKLGFPIFYVTDVLQIVEVLVALGYGADPRLSAVIALIQGKRDAQGRWPLEYDYVGKTWADFGAKGQPNPWVTLRALRVLAALA